MSEISKLIIPGNTIPYDLCDDYARKKIENNHLFVVSPLRTGIVNAYALLGRDVEPYEGLMLHILCSNDQNNSIAPASIRLEENGSIIPIDYANSAGHPISDKIYSFILHQIPEEGETPAYWNFYPMDDGLISKGIKIIEYTTTASTAYSQVATALSQNILPVVHYIDEYEYWLPLQRYTTDEYGYIFQTTTGAWDTLVEFLSVGLYSSFWDGPHQFSTNEIPSVSQYKSLYYGTCSNTANLVAKTVTGVANWPSNLSAGQTILIKFSNGNTAANPTLNINNTGAKTIKASGATNVGSNSAFTSWSAGDIVLFVYDGTYWRFVKGVDKDTVQTPSSLGFAYCTCNTATATNNKVATVVSGDSIADNTVANSIIIVQFTNAVNSLATLAIGNNHDYDIYYNGSPLTDGIILANDIVTFVHDGDYWNIVNIEHNGARTRGLNIESSDDTKFVITQTSTCTAYISDGLIHCFGSIEGTLKANNNFNEIVFNIYGDNYVTNLMSFPLGNATIRYTYASKENYKFSIVVCDGASFGQGYFEITMPEVNWTPTSDTANVMIYFSLTYPYNYSAITGSESK